ncbi:MAG TPA: hypothetical protein VK742_02345 [Candidatus Sulfotelmatobacter sp.]|nr:hypothetical protein [Candidatus Sulfotelmatobacter sp.]
MSQAFMDRQHHRRALFGRQLQQRHLRLPRHLNFAVRLTHGFRSQLLGTARVGVVSPHLIPPPVQAAMDGNAAQPSGKLRAALKRPDLRESADKSLLRQIFRIGRRPGHPECEGMDHLLMASHQFLKSRRIAVLTLANQICIAIGHEGSFCRMRNPGRPNPLNYFFIRKKGSATGWTAGITFMGRKSHGQWPVGAGVESDDASLGHFFGFVEWFLKRAAKTPDPQRLFDANKKRANSIRMARAF